MYLLSPRLSIRGPPKSRRRQYGCPLREPFGRETLQPKTFVSRRSSPVLMSINSSLPSRRSTWVASNFPLPIYCTCTLPAWCGNRILAPFLRIPASSTVIESSKERSSSDLPPPIPISIAISSGDTPMLTDIRLLTEPIVSFFFTVKLCCFMPTSSETSKVSPPSPSASSSGSSSSSSAAATAAAACGSST